jgi:nucleotide-binding universal stress UspA family protein
MYSRILVPLDGSPVSETAIAHALDLAMENGAEIILVTAAQDSLAAVPEARIHAPASQVYESAIRGMTYLQGVARGLRRNVEHVECDVMEGDPASAILSCAKRKNVDVIVMGTHRRYPFSWLSRMIKGSVAGMVVSATHRPVILVKGEPPERQVMAKAA